MDLPHIREYFLSFFYSLHLEPRVRFRSTSFETVRALVGNGLGYALLNLQPQTLRTYDGSEVVGIALTENSTSPSDRLGIASPYDLKADCPNVSGLCEKLPEGMAGEIKPKMRS